MKIRMLTGISGPGVNVTPKEETELFSDWEALRLMLSDQAEPVDDDAVEALRAAREPPEERAARAAAAEQAEAERIAAEEAEAQRVAAEQAEAERIAAEEAEAQRVAAEQAEAERIAAEEAAGLAEGPGGSKSGPRRRKKS